MAMRQSTLMSRMLSACVSHSVRRSRCPTLPPFDRYRGIPKIAMAYVQGNTLEQYLTERGKLRWAHVVRYGIEICLALCDTHQSGAIRGDLRPSTILVTKQGRIKLTDARVTEAADASPPTDVGRMSANTAYLAPEQIHGKRETGPKTDLNALGGVLYRMLTGDVPYHAMTEPLPPPRTKVAIMVFPMGSAVSCSGSSRDSLTPRLPPRSTALSARLSSSCSSFAHD